MLFPDAESSYNCVADQYYSRVLDKLWCDSRVYGQQQNAMTDYQAAISLDPKYSLAYFNAGNIYFHHHQFSQACAFSLACSVGIKDFFNVVMLFTIYVVICHFVLNEFTYHLLIYTIIC